MEQILSLIIQAKDEATNVISGVSDAVSAMGDKFQEVGGAVRGAGMQLSALTAPLDILGVKSLQETDKYEAMRRKFNVVFKDMSGSVEEWAKETGSQFNRANGDIEGFAANLQNIYVPMGFARDQAASLSEQTVKLGLDLASFNHVSDDEAINALRMGIMGSTRALKQYGITIDETKLNQELLNMGVAEGTKNATDAQKAQARLNIIMAESGDAIGAAGRENSTYAGTMKKVQAEIQNLQVEIGEKLMPLLTPLIEKVAEVINWFSNLDDGTKTTIVQIGLVAAAIGPVLIIAGQLITAIGAVVSAVGAVGGVLGTIAGVAFSPIGLAIAAVIAALFLLKKAWDEDLGGIQETVARIATQVGEAFERIKQFISDVVNSQPVQEFIRIVGETFQNIVTNLRNAFEQIRPHLEAFANKIGGWAEKLRPIAEFIMKVVGAILAVSAIIQGVFIVAILKVIEIISGALGPVLSFLIDTIGSILDVLVDVAKGVFDAISSVVDFIVNQVVPQIVSAVQSIVDFVSPILETLFSIFQSVWQSISSVISTVWAGIQEIIRVAMDIIQNLIIPVIQIIADQVGKWFTVIRDVIQLVFDQIRAIIQPVIDWFNGNVAPRIAEFANTVANIFGGIRDTISNIWNGIRDTVVGIANSLTDSVIAAWNNLKFGVEGLFNSLRSGVESVWNGLSSTIKGAINAVVDVINGFIRGVNSALDSIDQAGQSLGISVSFRVGEIPHLAKGGNFIVPPGYDNDNFLMGVQSGEQVQVTPRGEVGKGSEQQVVNNNQKSINVENYNVYNNEDFMKFLHILDVNLT